MTYTVKAGDTIYGISNQFGVSANDLANLNNLVGTTIRVGQVLQIPTNSGSNPASLFIYTVKKGDSLYSIARKYETTVQAIISLNNLKSTNLSIGQQLRIPENVVNINPTVPSFENYVVKKGDSLYSKQDNGLSSNNLSIGQNLKIRTKKEDVEVVEECIGTAYIPSNEITYTVKKGDSLYAIAKKYNTSVDTIKRKNNLTSNSLQIGQVLKI